jgi:hypothetical protein
VQSPAGQSRKVSDVRTIRFARKTKAASRYRGERVPASREIGSCQCAAADLLDGYGRGGVVSLWSCLGSMSSNSIYPSLIQNVQEDAMGISGENAFSSDRSPACASTWPVAVEQIEVIECLADPATYRGTSPGYLETATSHIFYVGSHTFILKRPMLVGGIDCRTPEARWNWSETQCLVNRSGSSRATYKTLPIVRHQGVMRLGGPGTAIDWVLRRSSGQRASPNESVSIDWSQQFKLDGLRHSGLALKESRQPPFRFLRDSLYDYERSHQ